MQFFDLGDYPMRTSVEDVERLADIYPAIRPQWVLTHSLEDPYNFDHPEATRFAQEARVVAGTWASRCICCDRRSSCVPLRTAPDGTV
jgi:LmbE family N-acetylglucosaminyl deacetylase